MSKVVIEVNNLGKQYRLGQVGTTTMVDDFKRWTHKIQGKEDPFLKIGEENDRSKKGSSDYVWALKDINFSVQQGEILGIIGKNGAGKSTLLKILSRTTSPSVGEYKIKGRVASLLEVGTGFHPDLTGRENVFLNGAILGMTKTEIKKNLDAIIDFSGVERYIDTPVKRYSSGMYVRLAFAVAAHLNPEILIVDEVLAVGDAEFRKKCLGKMSEVSKVGKTVLFVSHEMSAISSICKTGLLLGNGKIVKQGSIDKVINEYLNVFIQKSTSRYWYEGERPGNEVMDLISINLINESNQSIQAVSMGQKFGVEITYELKEAGVRINPGVTVYSTSGQILCVSMPESYKIITGKRVYKAICWFPKILLNDGTFSLRINAHSFYPTKMHFDLPDAIIVEVIDQQYEERKYDYKDKILGLIQPSLTWEIK